MNPLFLIDFYKVGHVSQYPSDVTQVWSNWTPRSSRVPCPDGVVFFGLQYFIKEILQKEWRHNFFNRPLGLLLDEYREVIKATLGVENPKTDHIAALHKLGYLPLDIYAVPEGESVPLNVPMLVITNTHPEMFWLPNYFETVMSSILWMPCTSATTAKRYRSLFLKYAKESGETDFSFINWMGHDFSERGLSGRESSILSGMGHLLSFSGTDTVPAIIAAHDYYLADYTCGGSVPATEHSVMCAGGKEEEFETFRHIIEDVYPTGVVSIVSDTWDLWTVLTDYMPRLKTSILNRNGKVVIRPDSGDPIKILCGEPEAINWPNPYNTPVHPAYYGVFSLLQQTFGVTEQKNGLPLLRKVGAIYGDSISIERADAILDHLVNVAKMSPYNVVFGIGSYTYQYVTRDTYGFAMKATAVRKDGKVIPIFKSPVTDDGGKVSHKGIPIVRMDCDTNEIYTAQSSDPSDLDSNYCLMHKVYSNGKLLDEDIFDNIRDRVQ